MAVLVSFVQLAFCDACYNLTLFDIGRYDSNNNSGVLVNSIIGKMFWKKHAERTRSQNRRCMQFWPASLLVSWRRNFVAKNLAYAIILWATIWRTAHLNLSTVQGQTCCQKIIQYFTNPLKNIFRSYRCWEVRFGLHLIA